MDSGAMIDRCFRHQHPEAYGEIQIAEPPLPIRLRYGQDRSPAPSRECLPEDVLGYPDAVPLAPY
ncbi:MAG TPA: hypothetical protein VJ971_21105 [Methylomirabilota bacterium]|jgi:hypothetical protein|nr:hypothetical protein [Methylomirabilota bacterium]